MEMELNLDTIKMMALDNLQVEGRFFLTREEVDQHFPSKKPSLIAAMASKVGLYHPSNDQLDKLREFAASVDASFAFDATEPGRIMLYRS